MSAPNAPVILVDIEAMAYGGKGIARQNGKVYFVSDAIVGDKVRVQIVADKVRYADAEIVEFEIKSPFRGQPRCAFSEECGGCQWLGVDYARQLEWKRSFVVSALSRIGKLEAEVPVEILASPDVHEYRNRILIRVHIHSGGGIELGYFRRGSRSLVAIDRCDIARPVINEAIAGIRALDVSDLPEHKVRIEIQEVPSETLANASEAVMTVFPADGPKEAAAALAKRLALLPHVRWAGLVWELNSAPVVRFDDNLGIGFLTIPGQFQQVNVAHNHTLQRFIKNKVELLQPKRVLDLFCGSGNLSLPLADGKRYVEGIESNKKAIVVARKNADANMLTNIVYLAGDAEAHLWKVSKSGEAFDLVILDPPRQGMFRGMVPLKNLAPKDILYVSCDPTTLARDLSYLCKGDFYRLVDVTAIDFFPNTYHIETVVHLTRGSERGTEGLHSDTLPD